MPAIELHLVEWLLLLLAATVALGLLARHLHLAYPILLVLGGLLLSVHPWAPRLKLDPQIVFLFFLPPLLYAGAFRTVWPEFRAQLRAISMLAVGLVLFTTTLVAWAAHEWIDMPWGPAFILGAIVSPPDAVAAMAVTQRLRLPKLMTTILEGESLVNDAAALVALRLAVAATLAGTFSVVDAGGQFLLVSAGGIALGIGVGWLAVRIHGWLERRRLADAKLTITITLLTPFAAYLPAEHLHVSGVLAAVTAGLWVGSRCRLVFSDELYQEARAVWEWIEFILNSLIFIMMGLMLQPILDELGDQHAPADLALYALVVVGVVIGARLLWMFPGAYLPRWIDRRLGRPVWYPPWQNIVVIGWTGMRGVVSLAAAMALPLTTREGSPFPHRDLILFLTFAVIFATLVGQGLTLPLLIRGLGVGKSTNPEPEP